MELINALAVLGALIGLAMLSVGWFITFFTSMFQKRWLSALITLTFLLTPVAAQKLQSKYALWLFMGGLTLFIASLLVSEWVNPRLFWLE